MYFYESRVIYVVIQNNIVELFLTELKKNYEWLIDKTYMLTNLSSTYNR